MEAVIFIGIQGAGKTTFYLQRFFTTHVRVSLDMLRTRHRERHLIRACLEMQQSFVVDNTNPTIADRERYIELARSARIRVRGYYFPANLPASLRHNEQREGAARIPVKGILGTYKKLEPPSFAEGFDSLASVSIDADGRFVVEEWPDEVR